MYASRVVAHCVGLVPFRPFLAAATSLTERFAAPICVTQSRHLSWGGRRPLFPPSCVTAARCGGARGEIYARLQQKKHDGRSKDIILLDPQYVCAFFFLCVRVYIDVQTEKHFRGITSFSIICTLDVKSLETIRSEKTLNFPAICDCIRLNCAVYVLRASYNRPENLNSRLPAEAAGMSSFFLVSRLTLICI